MPAAEKIKPRLREPHNQEAITLTPIYALCVRP